VRATRAKEFYQGRLLPINLGLTAGSHNQATRFKGRLATSFGTNASGGAIALTLA
jgi:hypothetical protein